MDTKTGIQSPRVSVIVPYTKTKGQDAISLYNTTGNNAMQWQESIMYDIMAVNDEGLWSHQKYGFSVPRRNGKSEIILGRCLYGLMHGERILYTAHRTSTSHAMWERLSRMCEQIGNPVISSFKAFGKEHLYTESGGVIEFRTRTSTGGLGEGYDLLIVDEAQEYTPEQETALKYVVSDSENPQTILMGTPPTAISAGTVFEKYRKQVLQGDGYESGWAEWSVEDMSDPKDTELWYKTNPSLGYILKERAIRSEIGEDDVDFNIQRLGLWLKYNIKSAISPTEWDALEVKSLPEIQGGLYIGVKFGRNGENAALSIAVKTADKKTFVECIDCRPVTDGIHWIVDFIRSTDAADIVIDGEYGKGLLSDELKRYRIKAKYPKVFEIIKANATFEQSISAGTVVHMPQPSVKQIVSHCEKRAIGSNGGFGYKSQLVEADISILDSMILATWSCSEGKEKKKGQHVSY